MYNKLVRPHIKRKLFSLSNILILTGVTFLFLSFGPVLFSEVWYFIKQIKNQEYSLTAKSIEKESVFAKFLSSTPIRIVPVNKDFSIVIEKIDVNAPIVPNVSVTDENAYKEALRNGIASAISSDFPTTAPSNVYLFAHSSLNFWELGKYATTFNLLRKLNYKDRIHVFYNQQDFIYEVANKEVVKGWDMSPLTRPVIEPLLTLQTCDPPGTTLNRFVVTAKLVEVKEAVN